MNRIAEDLKNTYFEMSKAQKTVIVGADALILELGDFLRRKRLIIMLRSRKKDGMKATETFDADISKLELLKSWFCAVNECTDNLLDSIDEVNKFIDKKYFDDAALFSVNMLSSLCNFEESGNAKFSDLSEIWYTSIDVVNNLETEERFYKLRKDINTYMEYHKKAIKILEALKSELDKARAGKSK